jgi:hypothetical protein
MITHKTASILVCISQVAARKNLHKITYKPMFIYIYTPESSISLHEYIWNITVVCFQKHF